MLKRDFTFFGAANLRRERAKASFHDHRKKKLREFFWFNTPQYSSRNTKPKNYRGRKKKISFLFLWTISLYFYMACHYFLLTRYLCSRNFQDENPTKNTLPPFFSTLCVYPEIFYLLKKKRAPLFTVKKKCYIE